VTAPKRKLKWSSKSKRARSKAPTRKKLPPKQPQPKQTQRKQAWTRKPAKRAAVAKAVPKSGAVTLQAADLEMLRQQLDARINEAMPARWNPDPEDVRRAVMKLVLTIVEFVRQLLERQAVRRMEAQTLTPDQIEAIGLALMRLEDAVRDLAKQSGLDPSELNLDLGPLGRLL
jgi:hypothetical protein